MAESLVVLRDIIVEHGDVTALEIPALDVKAGEVLALLGPNGAGKSTLLRVMGLLQRPASGTVSFFGVMATGKNAFTLRRRMASVFQEPLLVAGTVYDNVALGLRLRGMKRNEIGRRVQPWMERLGIAHLSARRVRALSGGEARRTSLARAFALAPDVLLLDEPFSALDQPTRESLLRDLQRVLSDTGITTILVTHERNEAFELGSRVGVLHQGKLLQLAPRVEVFRHPRTEKVAEIVGFENRIPGVVEGSMPGVARVRFSGGCVEVPADVEPGSRVILCVRAESVALVPRIRNTDADGALNRLKVKVTNVMPGLRYDRVSGLCGDFLLSARLDHNLFPVFHVHEGDEAIAEIGPEAVHMIGPVTA